MEVIQKKEAAINEETETAKEGFEYLARRLDKLWQKPRLTEKEQKEVDLILNNAAVILDIMEGVTPDEFKEK